MEFQVFSFKFQVAESHRNRRSVSPSRLAKPKVGTAVPSRPWSSKHAGRGSIRLRACTWVILGILALGQAALAGVTAYNDFGAPTLRNNSITRIGATLAELKAGNGSVIKTGTLINFTSGQTSGINLKLTVTGSPLGQAEIGADAPAETEAGTVFGEKVNCEGGSPLPAGKVHFIDLSGLDPAKRYELILFASDAAGGEAKPVSFTLWDCLLYTSPSPRDQRGSRMPSSA